MVDQQRQGLTPNQCRSKIVSGASGAALEWAERITGAFVVSYTCGVVPAAEAAAAQVLVISNAVLMAVEGLNNLPPARYIYAQTTGHVLQLLQ